MLNPKVMRPRTFLMCPPSFFDVTYSINPWMDPGKEVDVIAAQAQWRALAEVYRGLGHRVHEIEPLPNLPDMVFAANGGLVVGGRVLGARFRHEQRAAEGPAYARWFRERGFTSVRIPDYVNEGEGDLLFTGSHLLAGTGFRTEIRAHREACEYFDLPVTTLTLVNPEFYHLDTALCVLSEEEIMYFPEAFSEESRRTLDGLYPDAIRADAADAQAFGLNALSDGHHVIMPKGAEGLAGKLKERGFEPIEVSISELVKAGGGVKCCTLELRP